MATIERVGTTTRRRARIFEGGVAFYERRGTVRARERIRAVVVIAVAGVRPLRSPAYALGATEDELRSRYRSLLLEDSE